MRSIRHLAVTFALTSLVTVHAACSTTDASVASTGDAGPRIRAPNERPDGAEPEPTVDAGSGADVEAPLPTAQEQEPNNGAQTSEVNAMAIPGAMIGAVDPADDIDIFSIAPSPGELWEWTLAPRTGELAPHLVVFDTAKNSLNPTVVAAGGPGAAVTLEHFVLRSGAFVAAVRDARNVPTATGRGGPSFGYTLTAKKKAFQPTVLVLAEKKTGKLASLSSVDLYTFTLAKDTTLDVIVRAARKPSPSTLDSRLSLFDATSDKAVGTNDDATDSTDSELGGTLPAGTYIVILENEGTNAADLSYEIELKAR